jgi:hypothetical protein
MILHPCKMTCMWLDIAVVGVSGRERAQWDVGTSR